MKKPELVFIPAPLMGHLASIVEFAKLLLDMDGRLSITILVIRTRFTPEAYAYAESLAASDARIQYVTLPIADPPPTEFLRCPENYLSLLIESHKSHVKEAICEHVLSCSKPLAGIVVDMFCTSMIDVAKEFNVNSYVFFTSSASFLGFLLYLKNHDKIINGESFNQCDEDLSVPTFANPLPCSVLPGCVFNRDGYECFSNHGSRFKETYGIIINTFAELEPCAVDALASDQETPPVFAVGPLLDLKNGKRGPISEHERIMKWLDDQPVSSVVFLCFGSMGGFEAAQLEQIAIALERSGYRFLWAIRQPKEKAITDYTNGSSNLGDVLPEGFLERTRNRGILCSWAPQVDVLAHEAIGCFVSHCGWNSILESLWYGVPIVTWPIYAEQQLNAFEIVKELGLAVELKLDYRVGSEVLVCANAIEKAVRCVMDEENYVRKRVMKMKDGSRKAMNDGGSSFVTMRYFIDKIMGKRLNQE